MGSPKFDVRLELYRSEHFLVDKRSGDTIVWMRRTSAPGTAERVMLEIEALERALTGLDRSKHGLLFDIRDAPLSTAPEFAAAVKEFRDRVHAGFAALVTLTSTSLGQLQASRMARQESRYAMTAMDEESALAQLRAALSVTRPVRGAK